MKRFNSAVSVLCLLQSAGCADVATTDPVGEATVTIKLQSDAFAAGEPIPRRYAGEGEDVSPPLSWTNLPDGTRELALICDDPDAPTPEPWVHWVIYKIPPTEKGLPEGLPANERLQTPDGACQGRNSWPSGQTIGYRGPLPPPGHGVHHYHFQIYALDTPIDLPAGADKKTLLDVEVKKGLIHMGQLPRSRFFMWHNPKATHDIVVFLGEAQPSAGKHAFCQRLIDFAKQLGVERVFTFAAMATQMQLEHASRVFGAATDEAGLAELRGVDVELLEGGHIGGLNGVLLGVAAENSLRGTCLLGEMPQIFAQLPFPKASLAVLKMFGQLADISIDLAELSEQASTVEQKLRELLGKLESAMERGHEPDEESYVRQSEEEGLSSADLRRIDELFRQAAADRSKAYELKSELDRLNVFKEYEDRFLDLFK